MPKKPRKSRKLRANAISPALLKYFHGEPYSPNDDGACDVFLMELRPAMKQAWETHRDQVIAGWIKENPCTRPYAFWRFDAPEGRKQIGGSGCVDYLGMRISADGLPEYWQIQWDKNDPPTFESEGAYLERHGLLTAPEKTFLKKHPALLEPERIEFDEG